MPVAGGQRDRLLEHRLLELALKRVAEQRGRIDPGLLAHISPALGEHVSPYGTCEFPIETEYARIGYGPLRDAEARDG